MFVIRLIGDFKLVFRYACGCLFLLPCDGLENELMTKQVLETNELIFALSLVIIKKNVTIHFD